VPQYGSGVTSIQSTISATRGLVKIGWATGVLGILATLVDVVGISIVTSDNVC
jgi:hypothetical protein